MCLEGASRAGADVLAAVSHPDLRAHFVWVPVLPKDGLEAAQHQAAAITDAQAHHYWDGEHRLAQYMAAQLGISAGESLGVEGGAGLAWDVYLAYGRGDTDLALPAFWMHQLGVEHAPRLDAGEFRERVSGLL